jgi:cobalt-zinc-cadmium efflux system outer membrane protein
MPDRLIRLLLLLSISYSFFFLISKPLCQAAELPAIFYADTQRANEIKKELQTGSEAEYLLKPEHPRVTGGISKQVGGPTPVLELKAAYREALINSPRTAAVRALLDISKAGYWAATATPNPTFHYENGYIAEQTRRVGSDLTFSPPWKIVFRLLAAKAQYQETKSEVLTSLWGFRNDLRRAYTEVIVAEATYQTLSDIVDLTSRLMQVSEKRCEAGDVPELDVLKARLAMSQSKIDQQQGQTRVERAKQQLNVMLGRPVEEEIEVPKLPSFQLKAEKSDFLPDFTEPLPTLGYFVSMALENRWELKVIKQQLRLTKAQLRFTYGNIIPDEPFSIGQSRAGNPSPGPRLLGFYVVAPIEIPVYNFQQGDIARMKATIRQFYLQYDAQRNQVVADVSSAYKNLVAARERIRTYREHVLADSEEVARLARRSYEVGQSDITSTLQAQQANVQIRSQYLDAVSSYQQAYTDLEQSVGIPLDD